MRLFDVLPERVLASPGKDVYAHVLFLLYRFFRDQLFGIPRDAVVDTAAAYLEEEAADLPDLLAAAPDAGESGAEADPRAKAAAVLRRLQEADWIDVETRTNYEQFITLADYAIQVLDTLDRIRSQRPAEYAGFVHATYAALTVEGVERQGALALDTAYDRTEQLVKELKLLHHNIKRYTERLVQQKRPQDILAMQGLARGL